MWRLYDRDCFHSVVFIQHCQSIFASRSSSCSDVIGLHGRTVVILAMTLTLGHVQAYSNGAPERTCDDLMPSHNVESQKSVAPYRISTSKTTVGSGEQIEVTLSGDVAFKGFFLRVLQNKVYIDGTFLENEFGSLRCNNQGITHKNSDSKNNVKVLWTAPINLETLTVNFVATFVQEKELFWTDVTSADIAVTTNSSEGENTPSTKSGGSEVATGSTPSGVTDSTTPIDAGGNNGGKMVQLRAEWMIISFTFLCFYFRM